MSKKPNNNLTIGVIAIPERKEQAEILAKKLDAKIYMDDAHNGVVSNVVMAWYDYLTNGFHDNAWLLLLEDDSIVKCDRDYFEKILDETPKNIDVVSFFCANMHHKQDYDNQGRSAGMYVYNFLTSNVAVAIRCGQLKQLVKQLDYYNHTTIEQIVTLWAMDNGKQIGYTIPNVVDHMDNDSYCNGAADGTRKSFVTAAQGTSFKAIFYPQAKGVQYNDEGKCKACGKNRPVDSILKQGGKITKYYGVCKC